MKKQTIKSAGKSKSEKSRFQWSVKTVGHKNRRPKLLPVSSGSCGK